MTAWQWLQGPRGSTADGSQRGWLEGQCADPVLRTTCSSWVPCAVLSSFATAIAAKATARTDGATCCEQVAGGLNPRHSLRWTWRATEVILFQIREVGTTVNAGSSSALAILRDEGSAEVDLKNTCKKKNVSGFVTPATDLQGRLAGK